MGHTKKKPEEKLALYEEAEHVAGEALARMQRLEQQLAAMTYRMDMAEPELTACRARAEYREQQLAVMTVGREAALAARERATWEKVILRMEIESGMSTIMERILLWCRQQADGMKP